MSISNDLGNIDRATAGLGTPAEVPVNWFFEGAFQTRADEDWIAVRLEEGKTYQIGLIAWGEVNTELVPGDPRLAIRDKSGQALDFNNEGGPPSAPDGDTTHFTATYSGVFFLAAELVSAPGTGMAFYNLSIFEDPTPTIGQAIDWGTKVDGTTITVCFATPGTRAAGQTSLGWSEYEIAQAMLALQQISNVCNVSFQISSDAASADFLVAITDDARGLGKFDTPEVNDPGQQQGYFKSIGKGWEEEGGGGLEQGGYGFLTLLHEFGHGMGLAHPHDEGGSSTIWQGVTAPTGSFGALDLNQGVYTVMSYNSGWKLQPGGAVRGDNFGYNGTMMAWDIAVLQQKYGARAEFNAGDDTYVLSGRNASGTCFNCIWDTGGRDALAYVGARDVVIDLRAATLAFDRGSAGFISYAKGIFGGFTIAAGVVIENAVGDGGDDILTGNSGRNVLDGNRGNDTLTGGLGADRLIGGQGADRFIYLDLQDSPSAARRDIIVDFQSMSDRIDLSALDARSAGSADDSFLWIDGAAFSAVQGQLRWQDTVDGVVIEADRNGDGQADFTLLLKDVHQILAGDLIL